jgi:hypothetical protein
MLWSFETSLFRVEIEFFSSAWKWPCGNLLSRRRHCRLKRRLLRQLLARRTEFIPRHYE